MISRFSVQNFRSVKEKVLLSFEASPSDDLEEYYVIRPKKNIRLLKLGLIYGANASGKTTILYALDFLRKLALQPEEKKTGILGYAPFAFDETFSQKDSELELEFFQNGIKYLYKVVFNRKAIIREDLYFFNPNKAVVFQRTTDVQKQLTKISGGSKIEVAKKNLRLLEANTLWNNTVLGGFLKTNIEFEELKEVSNWFKNTLQEIITPRTNLHIYVSEKLSDDIIKKDHLLEILKKADFKISDVIFKDDEEEVDSRLLTFLENSGFPEEKLEQIRKTGKIKSRELSFQHQVKSEAGEQTFELPFNEESRGTQRYYEFAGVLSLMIEKGIVFPIDEIETSLHPDLLKHFVLSFLVNSTSSQLIATTHHRELLMEKDILRKDAIWFTEKGPDGATELFSLDDFESGVVRNTSSFFNAYKAGKLGAVPELSDFYLTLENEEAGK